MLQALNELMCKPSAQELHVPSLYLKAEKLFCNLNDETNLASTLHIGIYQLTSIKPTSYQSENDGFLFRHVDYQKSKIDA